MKLEPEEVIMEYVYCLKEECKVPKRKCHECEYYESENICNFLRNKNPRDMTREELESLVFDLTELGLDLAQHLGWMKEMKVKPRYEDKQFDRAVGLAYEIAFNPYHASREESPIP